MTIVTKLIKAKFGNNFRASRAAKNVMVEGDRPLKANGHYNQSNDLLDFCQGQTLLNATSV